MFCNTCGKSIKFKGVGQRGEGKDKEKWKCTCGFVEYLSNWVTHPPKNEMKRQSRETKKKKTTTKTKKKVKKRAKKR